MAKVVLHIGLHKTGTSFIQKRTEANEALLPAEFAFIPRAHPALSTLADVIRSIRSRDQAKELEKKLDGSVEDWPAIARQRERF